MNYFLKSTFKLVGLVIFVSACASQQQNLNRKKVNIIYMIGDGMGPSYTSAYRYYQDDPDTQEVERTIFDELFVGMASTYPNDKFGTVTDSAASATALATGVKTYNGAVGLDGEKRELKTVLEMAKEKGYQTAMVVTSSIVHATPASFAAHIDYREKYNEIADQYLDTRINGKPKVDLLMGGGKLFFERKDRNLVTELEEQGYTSVDSLKNLEKLNTLPAIALLGEDGMDFALDSDDKTRLKTMTNKALSLLGDKPFFMLIEGSQIDWCGHANDIACVMAEMHDFAETIKSVKKYIDRNPNTVLVITADHSTGGLSLASTEKYLWSPDIVKQVKASSYTIVQKMAESLQSWEKVWETFTGLPLTETERQQVQALVDQLVEPVDIREALYGGKNQLPLLALHSGLMKVLSEHSRTGWTTIGHTGVDVQIFSYGKYATEFAGHMDNTDIAKQVMKYIN